MAALALVIAALSAVGGTPAASAAIDPLQALVNAAADGTTIDVPAGTYHGPIDFGGKALHLRGVPTDGFGGLVLAATIVVQGGPGMLVAGGSTIESLQFEIDDPAAPAIRTTSGHGGEVTVITSTFAGFSTEPCCDVAMIDAIDDGPPVRVERSQFFAAGGAGALHTSVPTTFVNNVVMPLDSSGSALTFVGDADETQVAVNNTIQYAGMAIDGSAALDLTVRNNVIDSAAIGVTSSSSSVIDHNLVNANFPFFGGTPGVGNIVGVMPTLGVDGSLAAGSPGVDDGSDIGAPDDDYLGRGRPLDGDDDGIATIDMGAVEGTPLGGFHAVQPFRAFDSRTGIVSKLEPQTIFPFTVTGKGPLPATGVRAVVMNLTGVFPTAATHLWVEPGFDLGVRDGTLFPALGTSTSNVNLPAGSVVPNLVTVELGPDGSIFVGNNAGSVDVIGDIVGWYDDGSASAASAGGPTQVAPLVPGAAMGDLPQRLRDDPRARGLLTRTTSPVSKHAAVEAEPSAVLGGALHVVAPVRVLDTRSGVGAPKARLGAGQKVDLQVAGAGGVPPSGVSAVVLNVTGVFPTQPTHITTWPTGTAKPVVSSLNLVPGQTSANLVTVKVSATGAVSLANNSGLVDLVADVVGWYDTGGGVGGHFAGSAPSRLFDSREPFPFGGAVPLGPGETRVIDVSGGSFPWAASVPDVADAIVLNVTGIASAPTHLTVWPDGAEPATSSLNLATGETRANLVVVRVGADGAVRIRNNSGSAHVIVDLFGWFSAPT